ncbi:MAG: hypothetical protein HRT82_14145 [Henriciella sp.]|nr:hypothetical protein [Henriciella sp.]
MFDIDRSQPRASSKPSNLYRFSLVAAPASLITASLFVTMERAVAVEDFSPTEQIAYTLDPYMEREAITETTPPKEKPVRAPDIDPPPMAPDLVKDITFDSIPYPGYTGTRPAEYGEADFDQIKPKRAMSVIDRRILPITPPVPTYPARAARTGLEGDCNVYLNVSIRGEPFNVRAQCTDQVF